MYKIIEARVNNLKPIGWMMGDFVLLPNEGRIIFGVRKYPMAFDVQLLKGEFE